MYRPHVLAALFGAALALPATAQQPLSRPQVMPPSSSPYQQGAAYNLSTLGRGPAQPPLGYAPPSTTINVAAPAVAPSYSSPSPYSVSTVPAYGGFVPGYGRIPNSMGYGYALQGVASVTQAQGQYWNDIQSARMSREKVSQEQIDTQRKRIQWEMEYEKLRPTAPKMRDAERAADLDWARNDPPNSEIWSGRTFNVLLKSILNSPYPARGPNISLEPSTVKGLNLTEKGTRGNLSLVKDDGKIEWTESLQEAPFDELRTNFTKDFDKALKSANSGTPPDRATMQDLRKDLKALDDKLDDMVRDLPPSRYIESRRLLNQLKDNVTGLSNARVVKSANGAWKKSVHTVAELVDYCMKNGLEFGPAVASGDAPAYSAAYYAIRAYERGVSSVAAAN